MGEVINMDRTDRKWIQALRDLSASPIVPIYRDATLEIDAKRTLEEWLKRLGVEPGKDTE